MEPLLWRCASAVPCCSIHSKPVTEPEFLSLKWEVVFLREAASFPELLETVVEGWEEGRQDQRSRRISARCLKRRWDTQGEPIAAPSSLYPLSLGTTLPCPGGAVTNGVTCPISARRLRAARSCSPTGDRQLPRPLTGFASSPCPPRLPYTRRRRRWWRRR